MNCNVQFKVYWYMNCVSIWPTNVLKVHIKSNLDDEASEKKLECSIVNAQQQTKRDSNGNPERLGWPKSAASWVKEHFFCILYFLFNL